MSADFFQFGPFRLEAATRSLYRDGEFVTITPKALDILCALVENAGKLVTKDELMQKVWPDSFVEEGSIANHVSSLRKILNPHFDGDGPIATVARRGYRFTAPVSLSNAQAGITLTTKSGKLTAEAADAIASFVKAREAESLAPVSPPQTVVGDAVTTHRPVWRRPITFAVALVLLMVVLVPMAFRRASVSESAPMAPRRSVAVLPMKNLSGDATHEWLSIALSETISAELAGGRQFRVVSGESVTRIRQERALPAGVGLTRKQLDDIGRDLACDLILTGNYLVVGGKVRVDVRLEEVATGLAVASTTATDDIGRVLEIVTRAGADLRARLGLDQPSASEGDALRAAFAVNPDALRKYLEGLEALRLRDGPKARDALLAAVAADDHFALAHSALSTTWRLLGYDKRGAEAAKRAFDLSSHLSREDQLIVEAQYHEASGSHPRAIALYRQLWELFPDNVEYGLKLGNAQWLGGQSADALKTIEQMRALPGRDARDMRIDLLEGTIADTLGDISRATAAAARAADTASTLGANVLLARARIKQGIYAYRAAKYDAALEWLRESETLFQQFNEIGGVADAIRWQGVVYSERNRIDEAIAALDRAYAMVAPLNYVRLLSATEVALSVAHRTKGNLDTAVTDGENAVAHAREAGDRSLLPQALIAAGTAYRFKGDFAASRDALQQAVAESEAIGDVRSRNAALNNSSVIDFLVGDLVGAHTKYADILEFNRRIGSPAATGITLANLSRVVALQGDLAEAEQLNVEECRVQESLQSSMRLAWCRTRLSELWLELGRRADAVQLVSGIKLSDFGSAVNVPVYLARFARLQLAIGNIAAADDAIATAERVQAKAGVVADQQIQVSTVRADVDAARGRRSEAIARLHRVIADAQRHGLRTFEFDARLVLARLDAREAASLERDAAAEGFQLIARKARALRAPTH